MKKVFALLAVASLALNLGIYAQTTDVTVPAAGFPSQFVDYSATIDNLGQEITHLRSELGNKDRRIKGLEDDVRSLQSQLQKTNDELKALTEALSATDTKLGREISDRMATLNSAVETSKQEAASSISNVAKYSVIGMLVILLIAGLLFGLLRKRIGKGSADIDTLKKEVDKRSADIQSLQDEHHDLKTLDKRLSDMLELQRVMEDNLKNLSVQQADVEPDHTLILSIANEMARIEQNLTFMDPATKGVSQLRNRAKAIAASLEAKGYEIPNLVGTAYREGDNVEAVMEEDEDMEPGKKVIRRVNRPCVMYKGKMIQCPKVVVAYNPD